MSEEAGLDYIDLGLNDVEASDGSFVQIPPGDYIFEVKKVVGGQSKNGNPKMTVNLIVIEALNEENKRYEGESAIQSFVLDRSKEFPRRRIKAFVEACGVEIDAKGGFKPPELIEAQFVASVKHETYTEINAVTQAKVEKSSTRIFRERSLDTLDSDDAGTNGANGHAKASTPEPEPAPAESKPDASRGRGRRRAAPSR